MIAALTAVERLLTDEAAPPEQPRDGVGNWALAGRREAIDRARAWEQSIR